MALVLKDRVKETTTTTGTGSFALAGAVTGYDSFGQIGNGNTTYYAVYLDGGSEWEVGIGTYTAPSTLSRDTILASSNAGNIVTFSAGQKTIWCDYPAGKAVYTDANGNVSRLIVDINNVTGDILTPDSITFDTAAAEVSAVAKLFWDNGDGVLSNGLKGGNVTLQIGTQEFARVFNDSGTTLTKGQAVYISGAQGNRVAVKLARADVEATSFGTIGLVAETMANGAEGFIIVSGALYKLNTQGLVAGSTVYLSPTTAGAVTTTKPQAPDQLVVIGWVERVDNNVGSIYVKIDNGYELDELHDVRITSPQSGNVLIYDASTTPIGVWKNANLTDGTGITITEGAGSVTIANAGVTALSAGTGISVSASTGSVTITNTAPDQTVALTGGTGISISGTYPNFTITNTAPDQTVVLTAGTGISVTGTYPSFTIANTGVTSVSGTTGRITSSGGATPTIDLASGIVTAGTTGSSTQIPVITVDTYGRVTALTTAANPQGTVTSVAALTLGTTGTDLSSTVANSTTTPVITLNVPTASATNRGALSSADWTTFNNKANAFTYTTNYIPYGQGTTTPTQSANLTFNGTTLTASAITSTGVATFSAGTVSAPAITTSGDTNNGIFFPAADTIAFTEGGVESMRIDSSGNVGIGTISPTANRRLDAVISANASAGIRVTNSNAGTATSSNTSYSNGTFNHEFGILGTGYTTYGALAASDAYIYGSGNNISFGADGTSAVIKFGTGSGIPERMRITAGGNVGIGTSSPSGAAGTNLTIYNSSGQSRIAFKNNITGEAAGAGFQVGIDGDGVALVEQRGNLAMYFATNTQERMRITAGGEVYIAGTIDQGAYNLQVNGTGVWGAGAYVNGSDERIKDNIAPLDSGLDVVAKLNPVTYKYKEDWSKDQSTQTGFIAQELLTALKGKNYVDGVVQKGDENQYMSVAYQNIIPILTKAIQEQQAIIEELNNRIKKLEGV